MAHYTRYVLYRASAFAPGFPEVAILSPPLKEATAGEDATTLPHPPANPRDLDLLYTNLQNLVKLALLVKVDEPEDVTEVSRDWPPLGTALLCVVHLLVIWLTLFRSPLPCVFALQLTSSCIEAIFFDLQQVLDSLGDHLGGAHRAGWLSEDRKATWRFVELYRRGVKGLNGFVAAHAECVRGHGVALAPMSIAELAPAPAVPVPSIEEVDTEEDVTPAAAAVEVEAAEPPVVAPPAAVVPEPPVGVSKEKKKVEGKGSGEATDKVVDRQGREGAAAGSVPSAPPVKGKQGAARAEDKVQVSASGVKSGEARVDRSRPSGPEGKVKAREGRSQEAAARGAGGAAGAPPKGRRKAPSLSKKE